MRQENVNRVLQELDRCFQAAGYKNWDGGIEAAKRALTNLISLLTSRAQLNQMLVDLPEPTPDELEEAIEFIKGLGPFLRKQALEMIQGEVPHGVGGRRSVLGKPSKQADRIDQVLQLIKKKVGTDEAIKRVAQKEGISASSMYRIWDKRGSY